MRVGIAMDHGGFGLQQEFVAHLRAAGHEVIEFGALKTGAARPTLTAMNVDNGCS